MLISYILTIYIYGEIIYLWHIMHDVIYFAWHKLYIIISYHILSYIYVQTNVTLY